MSSSASVHMRKSCKKIVCFLLNKALILSGKKGLELSGPSSNVLLQVPLAYSD